MTTSTRLRILQVHTSHRVQGGEDAVVSAERDLLETAGHEVSQYITHNPEQPLPTANALLRAPWNAHAARRALAAARAFRPDVVHVHNTWFALSPAVIVELANAGYPVVVTLHNYRTVCANGLLLRGGKPCELCVGSHPGHAVVHRCYRDSAMLSVPAVLTISHARRRHVWRHVRQFLVLDQGAVAPLVAGGIPPHLITVRPNFVASSPARQAPPSHSRLVVYVGRLSPEKGPQVLFEAWRQAQPERLRLHVYGDGPLRGELAGIAPPGVTLMGRVEHQRVQSILREARVLAFPSICREAGPLAPLEAASAGLPVLMSDSVGMASDLTASGAGWSYVATQPAALAEAISRLSDNMVVDQAGAAARELHRSSFSPEAALVSLEAAYRQAYDNTVTPT